jgi:hypothetical protein
MLEKLYNDAIFRGCSACANATTTRRKDKYYRLKYEAARNYAQPENSQICKKKLFVNLPSANFAEIKSNGPVGQ